MEVMTCKFHYTAKTSAVDFVLSSCWLTYDDNFIWAFIVPILLIIIVSIKLLHYVSLTPLSVVYSGQLGLLGHDFENNVQKQEHCKI